MAFYDKWIDGFFNRLAQSVKATELGTTQGGVLLSDNGKTVNFGWEQDELNRLAFAEPWTYSNLNFLMNEAAQAILEIVKRKGESVEQIGNHEFEQMWRNGGNVEFMDSYLMMGFLTGWYLIKGAAYALLYKDRAGGLSKMIPIPSSRIVPIPGRNDIVTGFAYYPSVGEPGIRLPTDRVWYWRRVNLFDLARGFDLGKTLKTPMHSSLAAGEWNMDTFKKGLSVQTLVSFDERMATPLFKQAQEDLQKAVYEDGKRFLSMRGGKMSAQSVGMTHRDAEYIQGQELDRTKVDRILGFPSGFWDKQSSYASAEVSRLIVYRSALWPLLVSCSRSLTKQVIARYYGAGIEAQFKDERPDNVAQRIQMFNAYGKDWTVNESREFQDKPALAGEWKWVGDLPKSLVTPGFVQFLMQAKGIAEAEATNKGDSAAKTPKSGVEGGSATTSEETATKAVERLVPDELPSAVASAIKLELKRWQRLALKQLDAGKAAGDYEFTSDVLPAKMYRWIKSELDDLYYRVAVEAVFSTAMHELKQATLDPKGNGAGLVLVPDEVKLTDADMDAAVLAWDKTEFESIPAVGLLGDKREQKGLYLLDMSGNISQAE